MLKILIAESRLIVREHLWILLKEQPSYKVMEVAAVGKHLVDFLLDGIDFDLLIAGWHNSKGNDFEWISQVKQIKTGIPVLVVTNITKASRISEAFEGGASGYLLSNIGREELVFAINHTALGGEFISSQLGVSAYKDSSNLLERPVTISGGRYSDAEIRLLQAISDGLNSQEIADKFFLGRRSIESKRAALMAKAGVGNTASLIKFAALNGLVN